MGGLMSYLWRPAPDPSLDVPDATTGLTPRQKRFVTASWDLVKQDLKGNGVELLTRFFRKYPESQQRFSAFKDVPVEELKGNSKLQAHANSVMYAVTAVVDNLDDSECLVEMLRKLGLNHAGHMVTKKEFKDLKNVIMELLQDKLGDHLPAEGVAAWDVTLDTAFSVTFAAMDEVAKKKNIAL